MRSESDQQKEAAARKQFVLQVHITGFCNNHCAHCYQQDAPQTQMALRDFRLLMDQFAQLLEQLETEQDVSWSGHVNITGGEPLMHPLFAQMLFEVWTRGFTLGVLTNGSLVDTPMARLLAAAEFVQVSLDGDRTAHDALRGAPDGCAKCAQKKTCAGGLRCLAAAQSGDWRLADPGCPVVLRR